MSKMLNKGLKTEATTFTKIDILLYLDANKIDFKDKFGVIQMGLFVSFSRNEQRYDSGIGIVIEIQKEKKYS